MPPKRGLNEELVMLAPASKKSPKSPYLGHLRAFYA